MSIRKETVSAFLFIIKPALTLKRAYALTQCYVKGQEVSNYNAECKRERERKRLCLCVALRSSSSVVTTDAEAAEGEHVSLSAALRYGFI